MKKENNKIIIAKNKKFTKLPLTKEEIKNFIENNPDYIVYLEKELKARKEKSFQDLTFTDGYMFGAVMLNKAICKGVLEAILDIIIIDIKFIELEKTAQNGFESKSVRFDVVIKDNKGNIYDLEMQVSSNGKSNLGKRTRFYQIMIDTLMLQKGEDYSKLKKSIIIFICPFKLFDGERRLYTFNTYCKENKNLQLNDEITKIFISTKNKQNDKLTENLEALINYINGKKTKNNLVEQIDNEIKEIKNIEERRIEYMLSLLNYSDSRREGKYIGEKIGEAKNTVNAIKSLIEELDFSTEKSMQILKIPKEEQNLYYRLVNDPVFYEEYFSDDRNFEEDDEDDLE